MPRLYLLVDLLGDVRDWYDLALCRETDPEAFFPVVGGSPRRAKRVCARCEVRGPCLERALDGNEEGVWGGTTEIERQALKHRAA